VSGFGNNLKALKKKGTLISFENASGAVPPFSPLRLLRPVVRNYMVTPEEGTHCSKLFLDTVSEGIVKIKTSD